MPRIVCLLVALFLVACGSAPEAQEPAVVAIASAPVLTAVPTAEATETPLPTSTPEPTPIEETYNPSIRLSRLSLEVGDSVTVWGTGYPPNTMLSVRVGPAGTDSGEPLSPVTTDENGLFMVEVVPASVWPGAYLSPVRMGIVAGTEDGKLNGFTEFELSSGPQQIAPTASSSPLSPGIASARIAYADAVQPHVQTVGSALGEIGSLFQSPKVTDRSWSIDVAYQLALIQNANAELNKVTNVPPEFQATHAKLLDAFGDCETMTTYVARGVDTLNADTLNTGAQFMRTCSEKIVEATRLLEAAQ